MNELTDNEKKAINDVKMIVRKTLDDKYKPPLTIKTGRVQKPLQKIPKDVDFEMKDGNTTFEVVGHFNPEGEEFFINQIIRKLGYKYEEYE